ncbi:hypothetical protein PoB_000070400 [Plakobranchus ocellatus]|uniref:Chitin-binding type-2 domain-containing protein n=1 Tax=Plakobranchus ocellatus TaxID=259542 RepID=A0AAV3XWR4_9GAST|nr:hypothetical protein PoB_000070400 [Plakobranchus ocellatus]
MRKTDLFYFTDDIVMREACGNFNSGGALVNPCCEHKVDIAVKNCTGYYVYYLSPTPSCPVAYCAGDVPPCPLGKWSTTGFAPCKAAHPAMKIPPVLSGPHIQNKSFEFRCDLQFAPRDPDQRFEVIWTFDGKEDPAIPPKILRDPERSASLDGSLLRGHMNSNVRLFDILKRRICRTVSDFKSRTNTVLVEIEKPYGKPYGDFAVWHRTIESGLHGSA